MLDALSKKVLKYMQTSSDTPSEDLYDFHDDLEKIAIAVSSDKESVRAAVRYLEENGYIKYMGTSDKPVIWFYLDHKGLQSDEFERLELVSFLKKSVFTPIIVAFLTSVLTVNLWPWILELLQTTLSQIR